MLPDKVVAKFYAGVVKKSPDDCWPFEAGSFNQRGWHRTISGNLNGRKRNFLAHRVAYELANGEIPKGLFVLHRCDNPVCCNPKHLFLGTQSDNAKDMWRKNRGNPYGAKPKSGAPSPHRKFDAAVVIALYKQGHTQQQIAERFGCSDVAISVFLRKQPEVSHLVGRNGGAARKRREALKTKVAELRATGLRQYEVADSLGISQAMVSKLENENGKTNAHSN